MKSDCISPTVPFTGDHERQQTDKADPWEELKEAPLAMCRQSVLIGWIPSLQMCSSGPTVSSPVQLATTLTTAAHFCTSLDEYLPGREGGEAKWASP